MGPTGAACQPGYLRRRLRRHFAYGGLKVDTHMRVLDTRDRPIAGLYAAGEMTGGFFYHGYPSGSGLMRGSVTGRIAGREAAGG